MIESFIRSERHLWMALKSFTQRVPRTWSSALGTFCSPYSSSATASLKKFLNWPGGVAAGRFKIRHQSQLFEDCCTWLCLPARWVQKEEAIIVHCCNCLLKNSVNNIVCLLLAFHSKYRVLRPMYRSTIFRWSNEIHPYLILSNYTLKYT